MSRSIKRSGAGFTLIEALAALVLVAVVLPFVVRGLALSADNAADLDREATAVMLAQNMMEIALLEEAWRFGDASGDFDESFGSDAKDFTYTLGVADWQSTDFAQLTVTVSWASGVKQKSVSVSTVVYAGS